MEALLRILDSVWCKELGRPIGRRFFSDGTDPAAQAGNREGVGEKTLSFIIRAIWSENISDGHLFVHL